jgi:hypothetical protein
MVVVGDVVVAGCLQIGDRTEHATFERALCGTAVTEQILPRYHFKRQLQPFVLPTIALHAGAAIG